MANTHRSDEQSMLRLTLTKE